MGAGGSVGHREIGHKDTTFRWDPRMKNLTGSDIKSVLEVDLELKRIRKLAKNFTTDGSIVQGRHIAEAEAALSDSTFKGDLSTF